MNSTPLPLPARLQTLMPLADLLVDAAEGAARLARKKYRSRHRKHGYAALRPGPETPLWNELSRLCAEALTRYGEKAKLARLLGIPRQRLHVLLVSRTACPDAERTLQLLAWLMARNAGQDPA